MSVIVILILVSLALAGSFLACFIWAVRSGQFEDTVTPSLRVLTEDAASPGRQTAPRQARVPALSPLPHSPPTDSPNQP